MSNLFKKVDLGKSVMPKQQKREGMIIRKKRGRPRRPNMVKKLVKVDAVLYRQFSQKAAKEYTTIAALLARCMKRELER